MNVRNVKIVFLKESLETLRDRRTLLVMILGPVLIYPLLILAFSQMHSVQETRLEKQKTVVYLYEKREWAELKKALAEDRNLNVVETRKGKLDDERGVLVELDARKTKDEAADVPKVVVTYRQTDIYSEKGKERVLAALEKYAREATRRNVDLAEEERYVYPVIIEEKNLSSRSEQIRSVLAMSLPMILVLLTIAGAMYPAIDTTAGEKERGTIETILASPAGRNEIVYGKFLSVFLICMVTGLLNLAAMGLTFIHVLRAPTQSILPFTTVALVLVSLIPLAVLFSALMMAVSTYARTFREAQNYVTPIYLLCLVPAMVSMQRGFELNDFLCLVPVINMSLLFRDLMEGMYRARHILLALMSTSAYAVVALHAAVRLFHDENALFSLERPFALFVRRRFLKAKPAPSLAEALFTCAAVFVLYYYVSSIFVSPRGGPFSYVLGAVLSEWLLILLPVVLFAAYLKLDFRRTFNLRRFRVVHLVGALLLFCGGYLLVLEVAIIQKDLLPVPKEFADAMSKTVRAGFWPAVLALAVSPAICEEMMMRGFVLAGFDRLSLPGKILINGILFGMYHVLLSRLLPAALLGIMIAFIVVCSGSIFPGMLFHLTNNLVGLIITQYKAECEALFKPLGLADEASRWLEGGSHVPWQLLAVSAAVLVIGAALLWRFRVREELPPQSGAVDEPPSEQRTGQEIPQP